ncbi:CDP-glycerol glycerophosphotransferase family protein [Paeniglutamicibacter antarcticus]|uniref:CDP-glycerol glycerophosphotransferase family protein n=1 Tax=Paeniglutamicibacter antarcticus TaxID=494023 RepID=A0ABP9TJN8_9MICC
MNPFNAAKTIKNIVVKRVKKRNSMRAIQSSPLAFNYLPQGKARYRFALYFADTAVNAYQIRQWYEPMRELAKYAPVVVIVRDPATALRLREECPLPLYFGRTIADIEEMLGTQEIETVFYVNQNIRNFQMMRFNKPAHVFISHGESEKAYMWSNQLKAYDYVFSAGQAARDRLAKNLLRYDAVDRTRLIGRPQIDVRYPVPVSLNAAYKTVLYAPTWEGDRPSMSYGSVSTHGVEMMRDIVASNTYNVIFRPHPRSGVNDAQYKEDVNAIRAMFEESTSPSSPSLIFDESNSWGWQWSLSDICVTDVSAVAYDWMATGKPMMITAPSNPLASVDDSPALLRVPSLQAANAGGVSTILTGILQTPNHDFNDLVEYYFGDTTPESSMKRFIYESLELLGPDRT